jgi:hypothetical protein
VRKILAVICVFAAASLTAPASAAASACNDGVDNDGDGAADAEDSGCSPPYRLDDSEEKVWDTDATSKFDGSSINSAPKDSVSLMVPGELKDGEGGSLRDSGSPLQEGFVLGPGDGATDKYGQGGFSSTSLSIPDSWETRNTGFLGLFGSKEYVDPPRNGDCGDGNENGESPLECPTDVGMADDIGTGGEPSDQSVSEIEGKYEVGTSGANNAIHIDEPEGTKSCDMDSGGCPSIDSNPLVRYEGGPNHYISGSNRLRKISKPDRNTDTLGTTTDYDLDYETYSVIESTGSATSETCDASGNYSCNLVSSTSPTTSVRRTDHDLYELEDDTDVYTRTTSDFFLTSDGRGYSLNEDTDQLRITVDHDDVDDTFNDFTEENPDRSTTITKYSCQLNGIDGPGSSCTITDDFTTDTYSFTTSSPQPTDYTSDQETFRYKQVPSSGWLKDTVVDVNDGSSKSVVAEDYGTVYHEKEGGTGYFSVDTGRDDIEFGNNRAFGWSTFDLTMNGNEFATERTDHNSYEADGDDGEGDTLVAVHTGEGIVGSSSNFGSYLSSSDIQVGCPDPYTKCVAAVDVSLNSFDTWSSYNDPGSGAEYSVVAKAGLGEGLSACKMYQNLNSGGEEVQCTYEHGTSPLPYGPYTDEPSEFKGVFAGPEADNSRNTENPVFAEHQITRNQCVFNGTTYDEGSLKDIGAEVTLASGDRKLEAGGHNLDQEVCLNINGGVQGEWHDLDKTSVNDYVTSNSFSVSTGESVESLVTENPDSGADPSTGVAGQGSSLKGGSLEDDCHSSLICGDNGPPYFVPFYEGAVTADYNPFESGGDVDGDGEMERQVDLQEWRNNHPVPASVSSITGEVGPPSDAGGPPEGVEGGMPRGVQSAQEAEGVHNTVNTSDGSEHGSGIGQSKETDLDLGPLENSRIDPEDDEWGISPNLSYVIDNFGRSKAMGQCHGEDRDQGNDLNKTQRTYANSYASDSSRGGEWVDPDTTVRAVSRGGITCDLTGKDWGIAYDTLVTSELLPEAGGKMPEDKGLTFNGRGKLIPPMDGGTGGTPYTDLCIGEGCDVTEGLPTDRDDDTFVDEEGDNMSGTLVTPKLQLRDDLCIGSRCEVEEHIESDGLGADNTEGDQLDLVVPSITASSGDLCVGSTSEC